MQSSPLKKFDSVLGPLLFVLTILFFHPEGLSKEANAVLATKVIMLPIGMAIILQLSVFPENLKVD
ncbi:MAG: hypothetical protein KAJ28_07340 [Flavobacteriaceae bacterium]|nr:hypothetical protein [Flavobacteriaceae bacterium]